MDLGHLSFAQGATLEALFAFHRRVERRLADLAALPIHVECHGADVRAIAVARAVLATFEDDAAAQHEREEERLLPRLARGVDAASAGAFAELRGRLASDHREIERTWRSLRRPLLALAEGVERRPGEATYFRALWAAHISMEEAALHRVAVTRAASARNRHRAVTVPTRD